jgi:hypothetical protein
MLKGFKMFEVGFYKMKNHYKSGEVNNLTSQAVALLSLLGRWGYIGLLRIHVGQRHDPTRPPVFLSQKAG